MECVPPPVNITQMKLVLLDTHNSLHEMLFMPMPLILTNSVEQSVNDILILLLISKPYYNIIKILCTSR